MKRLAAWGVPTPPFFGTEQIALAWGFLGIGVDVVTTGDADSDKVLQLILSKAESRPLRDHRLSGVRQTRALR
jgi:hypothetical protein